jgi:heat shock protein HslJ
MLWRLWQAVITLNVDAVLLIMAAFSLVILIAGCIGTGTPPPLIGTAWTLVEIRNETGDLVPVLAGTCVTAAFSSDGRVSGSAGCNRYFAGYTTSEDRIAITNAGSTRMYCHEPEGVMIQEARFLGHLTASTGYRIEGDALTLLGDGDRPLLVFREEPR